eukprot:GEMP01007804.1.p1 GENE.GEMP01007804.1~~GEMP01007804.1.p1  ORF type:complete len:977 (-),score=242.73 GEMP01007804.1:690-3593(-)
MIDGVDVAALIAKIPLPGSDKPRAPTASGFTASTSRPPPRFVPDTSHVRSSSSTSDPRRSHVSYHHEPTHSSSAVHCHLNDHPALGDHKLNADNSPRLDDPHRQHASGDHKLGAENLLRIDPHDQQASGDHRLSAENLLRIDTHSQQASGDHKLDAEKLLRIDSHEQTSCDRILNAENVLIDPCGQPQLRNEEARMVVSIDGHMHDWNHKTKSAHGVDMNSSLDAEKNSNDGARHGENAHAPEPFLFQNERQQILACLEDREWHVAWLEEALCSQSEEFSQSVDEKASELQTSKEREIVLHARAEASSRELGTIRDELTEAVKLQKERYLEMENLHQLSQQLRSELSVCEDRNAALQLANHANAEVQRELGALKEAIAAKDRTIAKFEEERRHRPQRQNEKYAHGPDPRLEKMVSIEEFAAAQSEAAKLRERLADVERMRNHEIAKLNDSAREPFGNASIGLHNGDVIALKNEVDSLRSELFAASASEREAQQLACSVLDELKEARLAQDQQNATAVAQQLAANNDSRSFEDVFRAQIANLEQQIGTLDETVAARDRDVGDLTEINKTLNETNATVRRKLALAEERTQQLTDAIAHTTDLVSQHAAALDALRRSADDDKNAALDTMHVQMARLEEDTSAQVETMANERMRALEVAHKEVYKRTHEEADILRAQLRAEEAKVKTGQTELRALHQEKAQMGVARRDLESKMEGKMDDLRWQVKMRDLDKLKLGEDREQELNDRRRDVEALRRKQVDQKDSKLLEECKRENRVLEEKVSNLEREKEKIEQLRQHFAQEAATLRKVLQEQSESTVENEELRRTIRNLEKARNADQQKNHDINSLRQRLNQLEKNQQRSVPSSLCNVVSRSYDDDASPQPRRRAADRNDVARRDVRHSADSCGRRAMDKNLESERTRARWQRSTSHGLETDLGTSQAKGRTYRSKAKLLGLLSDSDSSLERLVIESDPFRRG